MPSRLTTRRQFLRRAAIAGVAGAAAIASDAVGIAPNRPHLVRKEIALRRWPERLNGFTIVMLSDFHYDQYFSVHPLKAAIGMVNALHPDMIVLGGDFVSMPLFDGDDEAAAALSEPCAKELAKLNAAEGIWAVLGNHDDRTDPKRVTHSLEAQGITVLANRSAAITRNGARFWLGGVNDVLSYSADLPQTLDGIPGDEATILLAHEPDYADEAARFPVDLQLSGHSHAGQVRLPWLPPLYLPEMARKYYWGLYQVGSLTLYTNAGLGTVGVPARLNCPPEITLFTLYRSTQR